MTQTVARGLDGVVVDETAVCLADKQNDRLYYRGYSIEDIAERATYEEVAYLLIHGRLPTCAELDDYKKKLIRAH
jgi:citrate synthase